MRKINGKSNLSGEYLKNCRLEKDINRSQMTTKLQLHGLNVTRDYVYRVEAEQVILKDFELIIFAIVLDIDLNELKEIYKKTVKEVE